MAAVSCAGCGRRASANLVEAGRYLLKTCRSCGFTTELANPEADRTEFTKDQVWEGQR